MTTYAYYRLPDGSILPADATPNEHVKRINEKWQPLTQYGIFTWDAYYADHPYEVLFQRGGSGELSPGQLREMGYDHSPPAVPVCNMVATDRHSRSGQRLQTPGHVEECWVNAPTVQFGQLDGEASGPHACGYCERANLPTIKALEQHIEVMHRDSKQTRELGRVIAQGVSGLNPSPVPVAASSNGGDYACGRCSARFKNAFKLNSHLSEHKRAS